MALNIFKWILGKSETETDQTGTKVSLSDFMDEELGSAIVGIELYIQRMAFWTAVRKIAAAVSAVEWQTVRRGKKVESEEYWSWNYSPNPNQTREEFFMDLIGTLYSKQEALIVQTKKGYRYVADGFSKTERLDGDIYTDITAHNDSIPGEFRSSDVLHFAIEGEKIRAILLMIAANEGKLIKSAQLNYLKSQGTRGILHIDDTAEADPSFEETYEDLVQEKFKNYVSNPNAVLPMYKGYDFQQTETKGGSTKSELAGTRDIRNMLDDIVEFTAQTFGIPVSILTGKNVSTADFQTFITQIVQPLVMNIANEINRKLYGQQLVKKGTYIVPDMSGIKYVDAFDVAAPIDKLISSGAFCVNDIRSRLGMDIIDEEWAYQHWMTKNYAPTDELLEGVDDTNDAPVQPDENKEDEDENGNENE